MTSPEDKFEPQGAQPCVPGEEEASSKLAQQLAAGRILAEYREEANRRSSQFFDERFPERGHFCGTTDFRNQALNELELPEPPDLHLPAARLPTMWNRDPLAVLGVGSAVVAFLLWAWPDSYEPGNFSRSLFFEAERLPAVAVFLVLSLILLLLRRR